MVQSIQDELMRRIMTANQIRSIIKKEFSNLPTEGSGEVNERIDTISNSIVSLQEIIGSDKTSDNPATGLFARLENYCTKEEVKEIIEGSGYVTEKDLTPILERINSIESPDVGSLDVLGVVKGSSDENKIYIETDGTMSVNSISFNKIMQDDDSSVIFDCGSASL